MADYNAQSLNVAARALPFDTLIGSPLVACIDAQKKSAEATLNYIKSSGLLETKKEKEYEVDSISFTYEMDGVIRKLTVPILSIVPIPYMAIDTVKINFRAEMSIDQQNNLVGKYSSLNNVNIDSTQASKYNVQSQLDVEVIATGSALPSGLNKLLSVLEGAIKVEDIKK